MKEYDFTLVFCPRWGVRNPWTAPAYLLEAVRSQGIKANYIDYNIRLYWDTYTPQLWNDNLQHQFWKTQDLDYFIDQIDLKEIKAPIVGFSLTETNIRFSVALARRLRRYYPDKLILFGGHRIFYKEDADKEVPLDACDAIIKGEGELTLVDIIKKGLSNNPGTFTPGKDSWIFNGNRELIHNLDMFPWPKYEDVDWQNFPSRELAIMGSRGCIYRCSFCNDIVRAEFKYRKRSAEHIAEEMLYHKKKNNIGFTMFNDPVLNGHYTNLDRLCEILIKNNFNRPWAGNMAVRKNMPEALLHKVRRSGLKTVIIGIECGSPKVLSLMKKPTTVEDAISFINKLYLADIKIELNLVVGFPGETEDDFKQTLKLITDLAPKISRIVSICTLNVDRSYLFDHLEEFKVICDTQDLKRHINWKTKDGLNTYEIRSERAKRLVNQAKKLNLTHDRFDLDIERKDTMITMTDVKHNRSFFEKLKLVSSEGTRLVYIWGAGQGGVDTYNNLIRAGINISAFLDSSPKICGNDLLGRKIISPVSLERYKPDKNRPFVVIGSIQSEEISSQLNSWGFQKGKDYVENIFFNNLCDRR